MYLKHFFITISKDIFYFITTSKDNFYQFYFVYAKYKIVTNIVNKLETD